MRKLNNNKSIGFFYGLFEEIKEKCFITEYSIQQTSLEQIFNKFASNQGKINKTNDEEQNLDEENNIVIDDILISKLVTRN